MGIGSLLGAMLAMAASGAPSALAPSATLQAPVASPPYQAYLARLFSTLPPDVFQRCPALASRGSTVTVTAPVTMAPDGHPVAGSWRQGFPVSGCGNDTMIDLFFTARADEQIVTRLGAPGGTRADLALREEAERQADLAALRQAPDCPSPHLRDTKVDGAPTAPAGAARPDTGPTARLARDLDAGRLRPGAAGRPVLRA